MATHKANYTAYKKQFKERQKVVGKVNLPDSAMLNYDRFIDKYEFQYNTFAKQVERGERKAIGNVTRTIVSKQAYGTGYKQAQELLKAYRNYENEKGINELQARAMSYAIERRAESGKGPFSEDELKELKKLYSKLTFKQLRQNDPVALDYFEALSALYYERKDKTGEAGKDAGDYISKEYFGS